MGTQVVRGGVPIEPIFHQGPIAAVETPVATTREGPWNSIAVDVQPGGEAGCIGLVVQVYATTKAGVRSALASATLNTSAAGPAVRVIEVKAQAAEAFDVTVTPSAPLVGRACFAVTAYGKEP